MPPLVEFQTTLTFSQFRRLNLYVYRWLLIVVVPFGVIYLLMFGLFAVSVAVGEALKTPHGTEFNAVFLNYLLIVPGIFFACLFRLAFRVRNQWKRIPALREPRTYRFTEAGVEVEAASYRLTTNWDHFSAVVSSGSLILLRLGNTYHLIPTEDVDAPAQLDALKHLLREKVKNHGALR